MSETKSGGCQCGRIRYQAKVEPAEAYLCHCRMCQRATGGVSIAFINTKQADVKWEREPDWYQSSPIARRPFCAACGTPLGFAFNEGENIDLTVGSFDEPHDFRPSEHSGAEGMHRDWIDTSGLPEHRTEDSPHIVERWVKAVGKVPE